MQTTLFIIAALCLLASEPGWARAYQDNDSRATGYRDTDGDGVLDYRDLCLRTLPAIRVGPRGCPARPVAAPVTTSRSIPPRLQDLRYGGPDRRTKLLRSDAQDRSVIMGPTKAGALDDADRGWPQRASETVPGVKPRSGNHGNRGKGTQR